MGWTYEKLLLGPVGALCSRSLACIPPSELNPIESIHTVDGLLGASEVNGLDTTSLLELSRDGGLGGSAGGSVDGRDKGALLGRSSSQLPSGVAESTGGLS